MTYESKRFSSSRNVSSCRRLHEKRMLGRGRSGGRRLYEWVMTILHARVRNGRVTVDEPTDLPDGAKVDLLLLDAATDMDAEEQAALEASIARGLAEADHGELQSIEEVLARLRRI
jgi:hypothetical protein